jgi:zinc protease
VSPLLVEPSRELPLVHIAVVFRGGAVHDPDDALGLARVTARMLRRGCEGYGPERLEERIDALGGDLSMHVGLGSSALSWEVLTRFVEPATELLARLCAAPVFDDRELGRLLRQSEAEIISSRDDDMLLASRALRRHALGGHPHGRRIAGTIDSLRRIDRQRAVDFHRRHYHRDDVIVAIAGDVDEAQAEAIGRTILEALPRGEAAGYPVEQPAPITGRHLVVVDKPERTQLQLAIGTLGTLPRDEDHVALLVGNTAFGGTFSSRLTQEVRVKRGWSYGASSSLATSRVRELFSMWSAPATEDAADCLALELELLSRWRSEGVDAGELARAQQYLMRSYAFEIDTAKKRLHQKLERALLDLPDDYHDAFVERVGAVTLAQVNEAVAQRIDDQGLWVAAVATEPEAGDGLREALGVSEAIVEPYEIE